MPSTAIFFWISLSLLLYCYIGYGIILFLFNRMKSIFIPPRKKNSKEVILPVTMIVAVYNEAPVLELKIRNTLAIDYPANKLKIIFVDDGSTDGSELILKQYPAITLIQQPERKGKYAAIKKAIQLVQTPVIVFSDANAMLNKKAIARIVAHYQNPKVGGVASEKKIANNDHTSAVGEAEGLYWRYESFMKKLEADFNTVVGAAGELFSIRTELFRVLEDDLILDDFIISMQVCLQGYKIEYEPGAYSTESASSSITEEEKRKTRISAGAYQSIGYLKEALNIFKYPLLAFQFISRRFLRWVFCPLMLVLLLGSNIFIVNHNLQIDFYYWFFFAQLTFYLLALMGWFFIRSGWRNGILNVPFYFVFMNYCLVKGFIVFLKGKQTVLWEKSLREIIQNQS
jgi:cellulose synthase/poly-beta-1,6-N-acetylglucosamine synthase-like glycosyltransferase